MHSWLSCEQLTSPIATTSTNLSQMCHNWRRTIALLIEKYTVLIDHQPLPVHVGATYKEWHCLHVHCVTLMTSQ